MGYGFRISFRVAGKYFNTRHFEYSGAGLQTKGEAYAEIIQYVSSLKSFLNAKGCGDKIMDILLYSLNCERMSDKPKSKLFGELNDAYCNCYYDISVRKSS